MLGDQTMKAVILCGGKGARLGAHGEGLPKALFDIGGRPILWHIMKIYAAHGVTDFVLCLGHKGDAISEHFAGTTEPWRIAFDDAGEHTQTGGRIKHIAPLIGGDESFMVTYGDGVADLDIRRLAAFHAAHGRLGTVTAVRPALPFGLLDVRADGQVARFGEKPVLDDWVNGGFFVFRREVFDLLGDDDVLEGAPLERMAKDGQLVAFRHTGFWAALDTYKDAVTLNELCESGRPPWQAW